jgi:hypothetical protein
LSRWSVSVIRLLSSARCSRQTVNHDNIEQCGLRGACLDHALKLGPAVVNGGSESDRLYYFASFAIGDTVHRRDDRLREAFEPRR